MVALPAAQHLVLRVLAAAGRRAAVPARVGTFALARVHLSS